VDNQRVVEISYVVRRSDFFWMYCGSWAARIALWPGVVALVFGVSGLGTPDATPLGTVALFVALGLILLVVTPVLLCLILMSSYGASSVNGTFVQLRIDDRGVSGWPIAPDMDRTWPRIRRVHSLRGVVTLPFRQFGTRAGWVPVPVRALTREQLETFRKLLEHHGVS
jgi:hypothetical protein